MIKPTVGQVVLFHKGEHQEFSADSSQPSAAIITYVWNDRMVNLIVFDQNGFPRSNTSVTLLQDNDEPNKSGYFCQWMDYQKGQAAKTEDLAEKIGDYAHERIDHVEGLINDVEARLENAKRLTHDAIMLIVEQAEEQDERLDALEEAAPSERVVVNVNKVIVK